MLRLTWQKAPNDSSYLLYKPRSGIKLYQENLDAGFFHVI